MTRLDPSMRAALLWALPIVALALALGAEFDWGRGALRAPPPPTPQPPAPVSVGLLPDYAIAGGAEALVATSEHTLFNPTRRPAPPAVATTGGADGGPSQMRRGQFILTGTAVYGDRAVAYLKETAGGKPRTVAKGEKINGMMVAEVASDHVRFTLGSETEDLPLKVAPGPKVTVQPAAPRVGQPLAAAAAAAAVRAGVPRAGGLLPNGTPAQPQTLGERRRAARAAESDRQRGGATAAGGAKDAADGTDATDNSQAPAAPAAGAPTGDPRWQQMYNRIRNRSGQPQ